MRHMYSMYHACNPATNTHIADTTQAASTVYNPNTVTLRFPHVEIISKKINEKNTSYRLWSPSQKPSDAIQKVMLSHRGQFKLHHTRNVHEYS